MKIYRVTAKTTSNLQPMVDDTCWELQVLYCGTNRAEARIAYHTSQPGDRGAGPDQPCRRMIVELIHDAETDNFADDSVEQMIGEA